MTELLLDVPVTAVPGVGPARARLLGNVGVHTVEQLLYFSPRRHLDARCVIPVARLTEGERATVAGTVLAAAHRSTRRAGLWMRTLTVKDDAGDRLELIWFVRGIDGRRPATIHPPARPGARVTVSGVPKRATGGGWTMVQPELERADVGTGLHTGRLVPEYPLTAGLTQRVMRRIMRAALDTFAQRIPECLPDDVLRSRALLARGDALRQLHFPDDNDKLAAARRRLAFEELFILRVAVGRRARARRSQARAVVLPPPGPLSDAWPRRLPFTPTDAQRRVTAEIERDLVRPVPMQRLLQGDVGSGKTFVAAYALLRAVEAGCQSALLAPSEILAEQHARTLRGWLTADDVTVHLLRGATPMRERTKILEDIRAGRPVIVVGTHALLSADVQFRRLAVVVVDEQHRFGVRQRNALAAGKRPPHLLVVSATPIPRTLALCLYGDLDVSVINELPPGRVPVDTRWVRPERRNEVYEFVRKQVAAGQQAFVVFPAIGNDDGAGREAGPGVGDPEDGDMQVLAAARRLAAGPLKSISVGVLHGRQRAAEQAEAMRRFRDGETQVLLATTIVEVGVDVPRASVIVIEGADMFGLAQLHQLRGRVGRDGTQAYCFLIAEPTTDTARRRLQSMRRSTDGFALARADLRLRGPGELLGVRQAGLPDLSPLARGADERILVDVERAVRAMLSGRGRSETTTVSTAAEPSTDGLSDDDRAARLALDALVNARFGSTALADDMPGV